jgi:putative transferase (TIGR04331 family)
MFLVTTGLLETLPNDNNQELLFLGEWCKIYSNKEIWEKYNYKTLPYHWDDREKLYEDYIFINNTYENYLTSVARSLNELHNTQHSKRYWRTLIGPWLYWFIAAVFDRYISIKRAGTANKDNCYTNVLTCHNSDFVPDNMNIFINYALNDNWNHYIYGEIIKFTDAITYKILDEQNIPKSAKIECTNTFLSCCLTKYIYLAIKNLIIWPFISSNAEYNLFYYKNKFLVKLLNFPMSFRYNKKFLVNTNKRSRIELKSQKNDFELFLNYIIPLQIPKSYIEGFDDLKKRINQIYPKRAKIIHTESAFFFNECFQYWCAELHGKKNTFVTSQHGGNMGSSKWAQYEEHQIAVSDKFYTWGWEIENSVTKRMPAVKLSVNKKQISINENGKILLVLGDMPKYSYHMFSSPIAGQTVSFFYEIIKFLQNLNKDVLSKIIIRPYPSNRGYYLKDRLIDAGFKDLISKNNISLINELKNCKLSISTENSTTFLETFSANYPTILFWNSDYWEVRDSATKAYDNLHKNGILHYDAFSAADKLNEIYKNPIGWWQQPEIQNVKNAFCNEFAFTINDYRKIWHDELKNRFNEKRKNND